MEHPEYWKMEGFSADEKLVGVAERAEERLREIVGADRSNPILQAIELSHCALAARMAVLAQNVDYLTEEQTKILQEEK